MPEILAPVGSKEQLIAAVRSGCDAVYLGGKNFNARMAADNFDNLKEVVAYCHLHNVKAYITLNTLFGERETEAIKESLKEIADSGCDAIIVADMGVALLAQKCCPGLPLHASTQMTVHNLAGAKALEALGFKRVVLARELTANEIGSIATNTSLEIEVFVHGALCMCMSGQCYLSSVLGQRSGNRGRCAQPCRLNFKSGNREYALSLKDLSLIEKTKELTELGVTSFKIEGRMKRPEYVAAAVTACKMAQRGEKPDMEALQAVFSRSGFTDGYFENKRNLDMFGIRTKEDVVAAKNVLQGIENGYKNEVGRVKVSLEFTAKKDSPSTLTMTDGINTVTATGEVPSLAQNRPMTEESAANNLTKLGGTPFVLDKITCDIEDGLFMPVSAINKLRQDCVEALTERRSTVTPWKYTDLPKLSAVAENVGKRIYLYLDNASQLSDFIVDKADLIFMPIEHITKEMISELKGKLCGRIPTLLFGSAQNKCIDMLKALKELGLKKVSVGNIGAIYIAKKLGFDMYGEYTLGILNRLALTRYKLLGLREAEVSFESSFQNTNAIAPVIPLGTVGYGHLPLMTFRNCSCKKATGCGDCKGINKLIDRQDIEFEVVCKDKMYAQMLNPNALYIGDRTDEVDVSHFSLYFTTENAESCRRILATFIEGKAYTGKYTRGLYYKTLL